CVVRYGVEVDLLVGGLMTAEGVVAGLIELPIVYTFVGDRQVEDDGLVLALGVAITVHATASRDGHFGVDAVALEENAVITRVGLFLIVTESRSEVTRVDVAGHGEHRQVAEIPVPF